MVKRLSETQPKSQDATCVSPETSFAEANSGPAPQDGDTKSVNFEIPPPGEEQQTSGKDIELGIVRGIDPPAADELTEKERGGEDAKGDEAYVQYTHVLIPYPGHDIEGKNVHKVVVCVAEEKKQSKRRKSAVYREKEEKKEVRANKDTVEVNDEMREVPIFCAICLTEYEISERVCWSSNSDCTHVFHEDCIVQWLISLGKTKSKMQSFSEIPSEAQLLNYQLECPCCRQDFISKSASPVVCEDEQV